MLTMPAERPTPQQKRRHATAAQLRAALDRLFAVDHRGRPSVAELAREAGVGRNAIYSNHRDVIAELQRAVSQRVVPAVTKQIPAATDWRIAATDLRVQNQRLATENAALLKRALDAEQTTARAEKQAAALRTELRKAQHPVRLHGKAAMGQDDRG
jgi:hypothetical protein